MTVVLLKPDIRTCDLRLMHEHNLGWTFVALKCTDKCRISHFSKEYVVYDEMHDGLLKFMRDNKHVSDTANYLWWKVASLVLE